MQTVKMIIPPETKVGPNTHSRDYLEAGGHRVVFTGLGAGVGFTPPSTDIHMSY